MRPTTLVDVAGLKVGIVGVMTLEALTATIAGNVGGLSVAPLVDTIRTHATALRAQGADVVIVAAHAGGRCTAVDRPDDLSSCNPDAEILAVARGLPRGLVDVIVAGHTHAAMAHQVDGIAITEAYSNGRAFGRVDLSIDRRTRTVVGRRSFPPRDLCERENPATKACGPRSDAALVSRRVRRRAGGAGRRRRARARPGVGSRSAPSRRSRSASCWRRPSAVSCRHRRWATS